MDNNKECMQCEPATEKDTVNNADALKQVIEGIRQGDNTSFKEFYDLTNKKAYSVAYQMLKKEDEAFDMLQDAYIKAYNKIDTVENPEKLFSWFNMIVANTCRDYLKKKKPVLFNELDTEEFEFEDTLENENDEFVPEATVDYNETKRLMEGILDNLSPEQKLCTLLYYYDEMSVKEIAAALECSENTVKSRLNYARKQIKKDVLDLEKQGTKLYGIAPIPFIIWMLNGTESTYAATDVLYAKLVAELPIGAGSVATVETAASTSAGAGVTAKSVATTATALAGKSVLTKVIVGIIVVCIAVGGGIGGKAIYNNHQEKLEQQRQAEREAELKAEKEAKKAAVMEDMDTDFMKGILLYATDLEEGSSYSDDEMYQKFRYILTYKHYMMEGVDAIKENHPNPLRDDQVELSESDRYDGNMWPVIKCDIEALEEIAKTYGYTGDVATLIESNSDDEMFWFGGNFWVEGDQAVYMTAPSGEFYSSEVKFGDLEVEGERVTFEYTIEHRFTADYLEGETETSSYNSIATLEITDEGYVIKSINDADEVDNISEENFEGDPGSKLDEFSEFGRAVLSQNQSVYKGFVKQAKAVLDEDLKEQNKSNGTNYRYNHEFETMFYFEDPTHDEDHAKYLNVVFRTEKRNPETDEKETEFYRVEYYNEQHNGGWDAIVSKGIELDANGVLKIPTSNSPANVMVYPSDETYLDVIAEYLDYRYLSEIAGPYIIAVY